MSMDALLDRVSELERENAELRVTNAALNGAVKVAENAIEVAIETLVAGDGEIPEVSA